MLAAAERYLPIVKTKRARGTTLQKQRRQLFQHQPLCVHCLAKQPPITRLAAERDHVQPLHQGGADVPENTQPLCAQCHLKKSKQERGHTYKPRRRIGADGYPLPEDPQ